jgi:hypothetical protein
MKHQDIIELLPWYVNATLSQPEREAVRQHLAGGCRECARELESLSAMHRAIGELDEQTPEPSPFMLNRALAEIEDFERSRAVQRSSQRESWWQPITRLWTTPVFARVALATQLALVVALGTVSVYQYTHPRIVVRDRITTLSGPSASGTLIVVQFNENATEREITQTLQGIHGKIVEGPSAEGTYTIQLDLPADNTAGLDQALQTLRQNPRVVRFAAEKQ